MIVVKGVNLFAVIGETSYAFITGIVFVYRHWTTNGHM